MSIPQTVSDWRAPLTPRDETGERTVRDSHGDVLSGILVGRSLAIRRLRARVVKFAGAAIPVLIEGPTGSGKELVAQSLHALSGRAGRLVSFNVSAIGETMFEDAIFGHVRGAFTGASGEIPGFLLEAHRGTVFLDEISTLPLSLQGKLLRALETGEFRAVGARQDQRSDFRLIAATNDDLVALARAGRFREDLLYRIRAGVIRVPPLRERVEDIAPLAAHFIRGVVSSRASTAADAPVPTLSDAALQLLEVHEWRGNVRELKHVVELALVLGDGLPELHARDVAEALRDVTGDGKSGACVADDREAERRHLVDVLERCQWNAVDAARSIGISKAHIYRRMRELGIAPRGRVRDSSSAADASPEA